MGKKRKRVKWYINKGDRTLGPVEVEVIIQCLQVRELLPTDLISKNGRPWQMIRDTPEFAEIIREVRTAPDNEVSVAKSLDDINKLTQGMHDQVKQARVRHLLPLTSVPPPEPDADSPSFEKRNLAPILRDDALDKRKWVWRRPFAVRLWRKWRAPVFVFLSLLLVVLGFFLTKFLVENSN